LNRFEIQLLCPACVMRVLFSFFLQFSPKEINKLKLNILSASNPPNPVK
jgi:hypothetical protein